MEELTSFIKPDKENAMLEQLYFALVNFVEGGREQADTTIEKVVSQASGGGLAAGITVFEERVEDLRGVPGQVQRTGDPSLGK